MTKPATDMELIEDLFEAVENADELTAIILWGDPVTPELREQYEKQRKEIASEIHRFRSEVVRRRNAEEPKKKSIKVIVVEPGPYTDDDEMEEIAADIREVLKERVLDDNDVQAEVKVKNVLDLSKTIILA